MINSQYVYPLLSKFDQTLPITVFTAGAETFTESDNITVFRPNGIPHHQFLFTSQGSASFTFDGKDITGGPGSFVYHAPYSAQQYTAISYPWVSHWVTFSLSNPAILTLKNGVYSFSDITQFTDIISQILKLENNFLYGEKSSVLMYGLILRLKRAMFDSTNDDVFLFLKPVTDYMHEHFSEDIALDVLADMLGITPGYFCKIFKDAYHVRPFEYIQQLRIQQAKTMLTLRPDMPVAEIGRLCGYKSTSYFIKNFKILEGKTPLEFRKLYGAQ